MRAIKTASQLLLASLLGSVVGYTLATSVEYAVYWRHGGTFDPRCVLQWRGFVEYHEVIEHASERVTCQYRPDIDERWAKKS